MNNGRASPNASCAEARMEILPEAVRPPCIADYESGISAIDTDYLRPGLAASHLIIENGRGALVDTGTSSGAGRLIDALKSKGLDVGDILYVFVTHIHLDHAGGAGELMHHLPNAQLVVHPRGARHMA